MLVRDRPTGITADARRDGEFASGATACGVVATELPVLQQLAHAAGPRYRCPGETQEISHAVHLSRMANYYAKCRDCPQNVSGPSTAHESVTAGSAASAAGTPRDLFTAAGIRGMYLTELTRPQAESLAVAVAATLWEQSPRHGYGEDDGRPAAEACGNAPTLVLARDSAAASPDIAAGVLRGLRRMGCHVIDIGVTAGPTCDFAVYHLRADAGLRVTGAGGGRGATGLDLCDRSGVPWSQPGRLESVREHWLVPGGRPTRLGGDWQARDITAPAHVALLRHGHGLRNRRVGVAAEDPVQRALLKAATVSWPLTLVPVNDFPAMLPGAELDRDVRRELRSLQTDHELEWLVQIAADGRQVQLFDERCRPVDPNAWLVRVADQEASTTRRCVVGADVPALVRGRLKAQGGEVLTAAATPEAIVRCMLDSQATLAGDGHGRIWFADHYPLCDGLVTIAKLARVAGHASQPVSHWAT